MAMTFILAQELHLVSAALWQAADAAVPLLAGLAGLAGVWLHATHPLPVSGQDAVLSALMVP